MPYYGVCEFYKKALPGVRVQDENILIPEPPELLLLVFYCCIRDKDEKLKGWMEEVLGEVLPKFYLWQMHFDIPPDRVREKIIEIGSQDNHEFQMLVEYTEYITSLGKYPFFLDIPLNDSENENYEEKDVSAG